MNKVFNTSIKRAEKAVNNKGRLRSIVKDAGKKLKDDPEMAEGAISDLKLFLAMVKAWITGKFSFQLRTIIMVVAALLYFINPLDLVPDFIIGIGYIDDASVIALVFRRMSKEIDRFKSSMEIEQLEVVS